MEKVAYLKGLSEGLGLDSESKEGKLISVIIDTLAEMAEEIDELSENALDIGEELDAISDDLSDVETFLFDDDFDGDDFDFDDDDYDDDDEEDERGCAFCNGPGFSYETPCPSCGAEIVISENDLASDSISCDACGEEFSFDFDDDFEEDEAEFDEGADSATDEVEKS